MPEAKYDTSRFSRQTILEQFGPDAQLKLAESKVLIIGCGGLGVPAALYLNAAGVGTIGLMDADVISVSNLHRQVIFRESDIGTKKLERLAQFLEEQNSASNVLKHNQFARGNQLLNKVKNYDLVLDCTDNFESRYLINDACSLCSKPMVYGAVNGFEGQVAVFNLIKEDGVSGNYRDIFPKAPEAGTVQNCEEAGVIGNLPGIIGTVMAGEAIKVITEVGETLHNKLWIFDGLSMMSQVLKYKSKGLAIEALQSNFQQSCRVFDVPTLNWNTIKDWEESNSEFQLIDVREVNEHQIRNVGGRNIPLSTINLYASELITLGKPLVFYCQTGQRSSRAVFDLIDYADQESVEAYSVEGGIKAFPS